MKVSNALLTVTFLLSAASATVSAQGTNAESRHCYKAKGISIAFAIFIAEIAKVSLTDLTLKSSVPSGFGSNCVIKVDTPKGPVTCRSAELLTDGKGDYWVSGSNVTSDCRM